MAIQTKSYTSTLLDSGFLRTPCVMWVMRQRIKIIITKVAVSIGSSVIYAVSNLLPLSASSFRLEWSKSKAPLKMLQLTKFHLYLLAFLVICNTSQVLLARYTLDQPWYEDRYSINHLIIVSECSKFVMSLILEELHSDLGLKMSLKNHVVNDPRDALKMLVPSILYLIQNSLLLVALRYLSVPVFQVLYQRKLCLTALLSVLMLGRTYHPRQWACLGTNGLGDKLCCAGQK